MRNIQNYVRTIVILFIAFFATALHLRAEEGSAEKQGTMPFSSQPDTFQRAKKQIFPFLGEKARERGKELPPPFGVMYVTNWMDSDWQFQSAAVSVGNAPWIDIQSAQDFTMDLQIKTNGVKADLWVFPFMDLMVGAGKVNVDATLGLRDIPVEVGVNPAQGDAIVPMTFDGNYYSLGTVLAGAYKRLYGAADLNWVKTSLKGDASLSADGFWTFTAAPKIGYNAGLSQIYVGARYISKNEHYYGTVKTANGLDLGFDVKIKTSSWSPNFGMRTVIRQRWEVFMESSIGARNQIAGGVGYRW